MLGLSWGAWWGLNLEAPAPASLPAQTVRELEAAGLLPAGTAAQIGGVIVTKRAGRTLRPELTLSAGPQVLALPLTGTFGDLYGAAWALGLYRGGPRLFQSRAGVWVERHDPDALTALTARGVRHVTLAFDQAARPVIAWELDGMVYIRQWDGGAAQYVTRGPWPGCDPLLYADSLSHMRPSESDVVLWYLTPDRLSLAYRVQRDLYAVQRIAHTWAGPVVLDQLTAHPYRVQLIAADLATDRAQPVTVGLYPVHVHGAARAQATPPTGGELFEVVQARAASDATSATTSAPAAGELLELVIVRAASGAAGVTTSAPAAGELLELVIVCTASSAAGAQTTPPTGGALVLVVVTHTQPAESVTAGISAPTGGTLE